MKGTNEVFTDYEKYLKRFERRKNNHMPCTFADVRLDSTISIRYAQWMLRTFQAVTHNPQKKFVDAVNGKSGLNFFDALESEVSLQSDSNPVSMADVIQTKSTVAIEKTFPEVLRDPILRKVQFSEVGRLDDLGTPVS